MMLNVACPGKTMLAAFAPPPPLSSQPLTKDYESPLAPPPGAARMDHEAGARRAGGAATESIPSLVFARHEELQLIYRHSTQPSFQGFCMGQRGAARTQTAVASTSKVNEERRHACNTR